MNFASLLPLLLPEASDAPEPARGHVARSVGRFAETPNVRRLRRVFAVLNRFAPGAAARLTYALLTRPPRARERPWEISLRERARTETLSSGKGHLTVFAWGEGPTVLLVHGWGARGTHLGRMVPPLVAAGYRVVAFDAPGHGNSSGRSTTLPEFSAAIAAVARHVGDVDTLIAHSFGVAMALWAQVDWGLRARRQVLFSSIDHCMWVTEEFSRLMLIPDSVMSRGRQLMVKRTGGSMDWSRLSVVEWLRRTSQPTLLVHDSCDPEVPIEHFFSLLSVGSERPLDAQVTEGLGHHRVLGDLGVMSRMLEFLSTSHPHQPSTLPKKHS